MSEDQKPATSSEEAPRVAPQPMTIAAPPSKLIPTAKRTLILMFLVLLIGIGIILWAWKIGPFDSAIESTDNSYVKGKTTVLSSQINGYVKDVLVSDFDHVKQGQVLMHIDAVHASIDLRNGSKVFDSKKVIWEYGHTDLVAAMRCYVTSKLGEEVEIPDALINL